MFDRELKPKIEIYLPGLEGCFLMIQPLSAIPLAAMSRIAL